MTEFWTPGSPAPRRAISLRAAGLLRREDRNRGCRCRALATAKRTSSFNSITCAAPCSQTARAIPARKICSPRRTPRVTIRWRWSSRRSPSRRHWPGIVLHLEIGNAVPESTCTDNTSSTPPQLCEFPGQPGVIGWKNSLEFSKVWPRNFASCAAGGDCTARFPYGQKDSYHYVLFGHSLAIPAWNTPYGTLTSIMVSERHDDHRHHRPGPRALSTIAQAASPSLACKETRVSTACTTPRHVPTRRPSSCRLPAFPTGPIPTARCLNPKSA